MIVIFLLAIWIFYSCSNKFYLLVLRELVKPRTEIHSVQVAAYSWDILYKNGKIIWFKGLERPCKVCLDEMPKSGERFLVKSYRFAGREWLNEIASI